MLKKLFKSANERYLKRFKKTVQQINALEPEFEKLSDDELRAKTAEFKSRIEKGETLNDILPEAFAAVREASKRTLGLRPFDVQLIGGMILNNGQISEMKTGEGKTLVATLPVYLNALSGKGVHVVTVNDYLAKRDSEWMGQIYKFLGLTVGCITHDLDPEDRKAAYMCDVTYATNNELGFDYLRDNMRFSLDEMVQRPFNYAIVDEVDSILIDEARTPLIISGQAEDSAATYVAVDKIMPSLKPEHYEKDEKHRGVTLTEIGTTFVEDKLNAADIMKGGLYDIENIALVHHVEQALRAHTLFTKDKDYIVKDDKVIIIDEFTGRMMDGRRYSDGLHQAIEAKEGVTIQAENQTLASITFQNYFRLYPKLAGMTGTAMTEAGEFEDTYKLQVIEIPTNMPLMRTDDHDVIYRTAEEKYDAIIEEIKAAHARKQPVLVGTVSIEKSEALARILKQKTNIPFNVLNARFHEQEASIIAQAGVPGAITIATNMAGRGTDIQLGGNLAFRLAEEKAKDPAADEKKLIEKIKKEIEAGRKTVLDAGGLFVLGSERHESRRIDNQLRGRSGRQGDPGLSRFYVSLDDDLMRIFGSERIGRILKSLGMPKGQAIVHSWITHAIAKAQQKVEAYHFDVRKNLLKYDDAMNDQRKVIYEQRRELMMADSVTDVIKNMRDDCIYSMVYGFAPEKSVPEDWDLDGLSKATASLLGLDIPYKSWANEPGINAEEMIERLIKDSDKAIEAKLTMLTAEMRHQFEKSILIQTIDGFWKEHLQTIDFMRTSIGLRAYAQKNPLNEYKREAFLLFETMLNKVRERVTSIICNARFEFREPTPQNVKTNQSETEKITDTGLLKQDNPKGIELNAAATAQDKLSPPSKFDPALLKGVGRNDPCPCNSGKKYKHCHGKLA